MRDVSIKRGWHWPSRVTVWRHWEALQPAQGLHARRGRSEAMKALAQPAMRDKTTISALEWVSLDGRTLDFWVDFGDGRAVRPVMLALVDMASNKVLDFTLTKSENATDTVKLIRRTCKTYGIFDRLYTDSGSAFAGHLVAGGNVHRFRNSRSKVSGVKPFGVCYHLGIDLHFALLGNGQAKSAERSFATLSRVIDDRPEFKGAHAGHNPGSAPDSKVIPIHIDVARSIIEREIARDSFEARRRSQGAWGRSYDAVFEAGLATRTKRVMTKWQGYLARLIYTPVAVDRSGRVTIDKWTYGQPETQADLLPFHKSGAKVLLGRDPDDFSADCIAFDEDGRLICKGIAHVKAGAYDIKEGIRDAARNRKAAPERGMIPPEHYQNLKTRLAELKASGEKLA